MAAKKTNSREVREQKAKRSAQPSLEDNVTSAPSVIDTEGHEVTQAQSPDEKHDSVSQGVNESASQSPDHGASQSPDQNQSPSPSPSQTSNQTSNGAASSSGASHDGRPTPTIESLTGIPRAAGRPQSGDILMRLEVSGRVVVVTLTPQEAMRLSIRLGTGVSEAIGQDKAKVLLQQHLDALAPSPEQIAQRAREGASKPQSR